MPESAFKFPPFVPDERRIAIWNDIAERRIDLTAKILLYAELLESEFRVRMQRFNSPPVGLPKG